MHDQSIVDVNPKTELLFMCHLCRINLLQPFYQRPGHKIPPINQAFPLPICSNLSHGCLPDSIQHFRGIIKFVSINMYPWENYHPTVLPIGWSICIWGCIDIVIASRTPTINWVLERENTRCRWERRCGRRLRICLLRWPTCEFAVHSRYAP